MKLWAEGVVLDETPGEVVCRILRRVSGFAIAGSFACRNRGKPLVNLKKQNGPNSVVVLTVRAASKEW